MSACIAAQSISRSVRQRFDAGPLAGRVLAAFEHAYDLLADDGEVVALVSSRIGSGPLNVVLAAETEALRRLDAGMPVRLDGQRLRVGPVTISLADAAVWEPRPDWERLRTRAAVCGERLDAVLATAQGLAPHGSLLALVNATRAERAWGSLNAVAKRGAADGGTARPYSADGQTAHSPASAHALEAAYVAATCALRAGWRGDASLLRQGAAELAGLGGGLTPAGDDWLCGAMLGAWLTHPDPEWFCQRIVKAAAGRTTVLSTAFLRSASRGECGVSWHSLLAALCVDTSVETEVAVRDVLSVGETSGADTLAGFLFVNLLDVDGFCGWAVAVA